MAWAAAAEAASGEHLDVGRCTYHGRVLRAVLLSLVAALLLAVNVRELRR